MTDKYYNIVEILDNHQSFINNYVLVSSQWTLQNKNKITVQYPAPPYYDRDIEFLDGMFIAHAVAPEAW